MTFDPHAFAVIVAAISLATGHAAARYLGGARSLQTHWRSQAARGTSTGLGAALISTQCDVGGAFVLSAVLDAPALLAFSVLGAFVFAFIGSRAPEFSNEYPEPQVARWSRLEALEHAAAWILCLAGYEALLRGALLFSLAGAYGAASAIAITTALHALDHLPRSTTETFGSFLAGPAFAALALSYDSFWPAFAVHTVLAVSGDALGMKKRASS